MVAFGIYPEIVCKLKGFNATLGHLYDLDKVLCIATKGSAKSTGGLFGTLCPVFAILMQGPQKVIVNT